MKKIYAVFISMAMLLSGISPVIADNSGEDWQINYVGTEREEKRYAEYTSDNKATGEQSIRVVYNVKPKDEKKYLELKTEIADMPSGRYTLSFKGLGSLSSYTEISVSDVNIFSHKDDMTAEELSDGWKNFSVSFDYTSRENNFIAFRFYRSITELFIDDVVLQKDGINLIKDSSFEGAEGDIPDDTPYDTTPYRPSNVLCSPGNGMVVLNWVNPESSELTDVRLYDITSGEVLLSDEISTEAGKIVNYQITDVGDSEKYYKIVFSYKTKPDFIYYTGGKAAAGLDSYIDTWKIRRIRSAEESWCPAEVVIDNTQGRTGTASMKIVSNIDRNITNLAKSTYIGIQFGAELRAGKKFRVRFSGKGKNADYQLLTVTMQGTSWKSRYTTEVFKGTSNEWKEYSFDHESIGEDGLFLVYEGACEGLWLDDFEIYELDSDGNEIGNNLLANGSFEDLVTQNDILPTLEAESGIGEVKLSWSKIPSDCEYVNIYVKRFENWEQIASLPKTLGAITISGLNKGSEYTFSLCPKHKYGYDVNGKETSITTILPDYEVYDTVLTKDGMNASDVNGAGTYSFSTKIKNNLIDDGLNAEVLVAVYNEKQELVILKSQKKLVEKSAPNAKPVSITESIDIPEGDFRAEVFVLDSRSTLNILRSCQVFE